MIHVVLRLVATQTISLHASTKTVSSHNWVSHAKRVIMQMLGNTRHSERLTGDQLRCLLLPSVCVCVCVAICILSKQQGDNSLCVSSGFKRLLCWETLSLNSRWKRLGMRNKLCAVTVEDPSSRRSAGSGKYPEAQPSNYSMKCVNEKDPLKRDFVV